MTKTSKEARLAAALLPHAEKVSETSRELQEWRREAGVKSKWSNHTKLKEATLFKQVEVSCEALTQAVVAELPAHWKMQDWVFKPARMGGEVRWAGKKGRARDEAITLATDWLLLTTFVGQIIGAITKSTRLQPKDKQRMKDLGLTCDDLTIYSFHNGFCHRETSGFHPRDAYASLLVRGAFDRPYPSLTKTPGHLDAIQFGLSWAKNRLSADISWSASPTLWARFRKDARVRKLAGPAPEYFSKRPPWSTYKSEDFDRVIALGLALLQTLPKKPGELTGFLVNRDGNWGAGASGWCGTSAILGCMAKDLDAGKLPDEVDMWRAFALADECGGPARRIAQDYMPAAEPVPA